MQLHIAVTGGVLQPVRHGQVGLVPLAGFAAVDPGVVGAGSRVAGFALEVAEPGVHGLPDHRRRPRRPGRTSTVAVVVAGLAGQAGVLAEGGVEERDRSSRARGSGRRTGGSGGLAWRLRSAVHACGRRWRAVRRPAAGRRRRRPSGRRPEACPAGCRRGLCAGRTAGRRVCVRPSGRARGRGPRRRGPTSGRAALRRSRWPGCSTRPRLWPGRGRPASRCSQGRSPCSGSRRPPPANPPPAAAGLP